MPVTLPFPPDVEAGLAAQVQAQGLPLETYLTESILRGLVELTPAPARQQSLVELLAPIRGRDLDCDRNPSTGRPIDL